MDNISIGSPHCCWLVLVLVLVYTVVNYIYKFFFGDAELPNLNGSRFRGVFCPPAGRATNIEVVDGATQSMAPMRNNIRPSASPQIRCNSSERPPSPPQYTPSAYMVGKHIVCVCVFVCMRCERFPINKTNRS